MNKGITDAVSSAIRMAAIKYRIERGLIDRNSDLYFLYNMYMEASNGANTELVHQSGTDGRTEESNRDDNAERPKKRGVRKRRTVRTRASVKEDSTLEGGA